MSSSSPLSTACPIPAEASTTTDSVVTVRMTHRGRRRGGAGGRVAGRDGRAGRRSGFRGRGERGGVGKGGTSGRRPSVES
ncbi:hypothetical protein GCM10010250_64190 [Streptomyces althioticus]|nr:hypothetical protein GCM10010250_64190 [Streptomyces althioticus]GGT66497.1 hypothetical protein GCM10010243_51750 [Streptomyces matensis]